MTIARRKQVCLDVTPVYYCITRCARRSFLCGDDKYSGQNYEHRIGWIENRLLLLTEVFCIDIAGHSIMSTQPILELLKCRARCHTNQKAFYLDFCTLRIFGFYCICNLFKSLVKVLPDKVRNRCLLCTTIKFVGSS